MKLTSKEKRILGIAHCRADAPISELAELSGFRQHAVRHCIDSLLERKLIAPVVLINVSALGFTDYAIFFRLAPSCRSRHEVLSCIAASEKVGWVGQLAGKFEYVVLLSVRDTGELADFFQQISDQFGEVITGKSQSVRLSWTYYPRKHLLESDPDSRSGSRSITISRVPQIGGFEKLDHHILRELASRPGDSRVVMAKRLGVPLSTLQYRVAKLVEKNVIAAFVYSVTLSDVGAVVYRVLLDVCDQSAGFRAKLGRFCERHPRVVGLSHCLGNWDYEVRVELENAGDIVSFRDEVAGAFGKALNSIECLIEFDDLKWSMYPFKTPPGPS